MPRVLNVALAVVLLLLVAPIVTQFDGKRWYVQVVLVCVTVPTVLLALACFLISLAQRRLSTPARDLRRRTSSVAGRQVMRDGQVRELDEQRLLAPLEGAPSALWMAMVVLAAMLVIPRL